MYIYIFIYLCHDSCTSHGWNNVPVGSQAWKCLHEPPEPPEGWRHYIQRSHESWQPKSTEIRSSPGLPLLWYYRNPKIIRLSLSSFLDEVTSGKRHVIILGAKWWKMLSRMQPFVTIRILRLGISEITTCWVVDHVRIPSPQQNLAPENGCLSIDDGWKCSKCVFPSGVHLRKEKVREVRVSGSVLKLIIAWTWGGLIPLRAKASSWVGFAQDDEDNLWRDVGDEHLT